MLLHPTTPEQMASCLSETDPEPRPPPKEPRRQAGRLLVQPARLADLQGRYAGDALGSRGPVIGMALSVASCATANGIVHVSTANGELFVLAMNEAKTDGWLYLGARNAE